MPKYNIVSTKGKTWRFSANFPTRRGPSGKRGAWKLNSFISRRDSRTTSRRITCSGRGVELSVVVIFGFSESLCVYRIVRVSNDGWVVEKFARIGRVLGDVCGKVWYFVKYFLKWVNDLVFLNVYFFDLRSWLMYYMINKRLWLCDCLIFFENTII